MSARLFLRRSAWYAVYFLLAWVGLFAALRHCWQPLRDLLRTLGGVLLVLVTPALFWLAPLVVWLNLRHERRRAAAAEADL